MSTALGTERHPVAMMNHRHDKRSPWSVVIVQREASSSHVAVATQVEKRMSGRRSNFSATNWR